MNYFVVAFGLASIGGSTSAPDDAEELRLVITKACDVLRLFPGNIATSVAPNGVMFAFPDSTPDRAEGLVEAVQSQLEVYTRTRQKVIPVSSVITFGPMRSVNVLGYWVRAITSLTEILP